MDEEINTKHVNRCSEASSWWIAKLGLVPRTAWPTNARMCITTNDLLCVLYEVGGEFSAWHVLSHFPLKTALLDKHIIFHILWENWSSEMWDNSTDVTQQGLTGARFWGLNTQCTVLLDFPDGTSGKESESKVAQSCPTLQPHGL